ncbi:radical SAM protein [Anaerobutyricum hallii]|uniref:Radical SAM protein n=1 Tax=Anaerobutyricum hallii TaxID=39488 RepID=A0A415G2P2_9FIRM|nr:radical SAM protein [Anaerobutyricum hallii]RHK32163.1 radical SAM protein [Anaerobutyricum hallii]
MKKITWDFLSVELTRKCQINCKHCFKGKCQNITISKEVIEKFLKQTEAIGFLHFTGGEPTLALEEMDYFLDLLYEYRIPLFHLQIITNGYEKSEKFVQIVKDYSEMIKLCYLDKKVDMKYYVTIGVSVDRYHVGYDPKDALEYYKKELKGYAKVIPMTDGNIPMKIGNGINLPEAILEMDKQKLDTRIEILSKDTKPMCPHYKTYKLSLEEQVYVVCEMSLSAKGNVTLGKVSSNNEYDFEDLPNQYICNVNDRMSIYDSIIEYNKDKKSCLEMNKEKRIRDREREENPRYKAKMFKNIFNYVRIVGDSAASEDFITFLANKYISDPLEAKDKDVININDIPLEDIDSIITDVENFEYRKEE